MSTLSLKTSDLVSGGLCAAYDMIMNQPSNKVAKFGEQVAYRVGGRAINQATSLPKVELVVKENDLYAAGVAAVDSGVRKDKNIRGVGMDALRAGVSSWAADWVHQLLKIEDRTLLSL